MNRKQREFEKRRAIRLVKLPKSLEKSGQVLAWPGERSRYLAVIGMAIIALCTVIIYGQTVRVPPIDYEDSVSWFTVLTSGDCAIFQSGAVWNEPYFANFHPVTTTTWLLDRRLSRQSVPFDGRTVSLHAATLCCDRARC